MTCRETTRPDSAGPGRRRDTEPEPSRQLLPAEEHPVGRVGRLVDVVVAEPVEKAPELAAVARRHLHPDEHASVVGAVVAVVEEAYVPAGAHAVEKAHQRAGTLGKFE